MSDKPTAYAAIRDAAVKFLEVAQVDEDYSAECELIGALDAIKSRLITRCFTDQMVVSEEEDPDADAPWRESLDMDDDFDAEEEDE